LADAEKIRILLADGQSLFREAVKVVLESEPGLVVVAEASEGLEVVAAAERTRPNVALIDMNLANCDGVRATYLITERVPECRICVLAVEEDERTLVDAVEAGATGFVTKESPLSELIGAVRTLHAGETIIPSRMLGPLLSRLIQRRREQDDALRKASELTRREREVLALLADGADNDSIAQALVISPQTARTHIQNLLGKLGVHSRLEAAAFVVRNGILDVLIGANR
jgi:two-component system, NarL family, response regulator LiaR